MLCNNNGCYLQPFWSSTFASCQNHSWLLNSTTNGSTPSRRKNNAFCILCTTFSCPCSESCELSCFIRSCCLLLVVAFHDSFQWMISVRSCNFQFFLLPVFPDWRNYIFFRSTPPLPLWHNRSIVWLHSGDQFTKNIRKIPKIILHTS